jgi:hypothetical protein
MATPITKSRCSWPTGNTLGVSFRPPFLVNIRLNAKLLLKPPKCKYLVSAQYSCKEAGDDTASLLL